MRRVYRAGPAWLLVLAMTGCALPLTRGGSAVPVSLASLPAAAGEIAILNGHLITDMEEVAVVGSGGYRYRFVLLDARSGEPAAHRPYALSNRHHRLPFVTEEKQVYQGITDQYGRTDAFAFEIPLSADSWFLRERFGAGPFGEQMRLVDAEDHAVTGMAYVLLICDASPRYHRGLTDADGNTGYAATAAVATIILGVQGADPVEEADIDADEDEDAVRASQECQRDAAQNSQAAMTLPATAD